MFLPPGEEEPKSSKPEKATIATNKIKSKNPSSATILKSKSDKAPKKHVKTLKTIAKKVSKHSGKKFTKDENKKVPKKEVVSTPFEKFQQLAKQIDQKVKSLKEKVDKSPQVKAQIKELPQSKQSEKAPEIAPSPLPELEGSGSGSGSGDAGKAYAPTFRKSSNNPPGGLYIFWIFLHGGLFGGG